MLKGSFFYLGFITFPCLFVSGCDEAPSKAQVAGIYNGSLFGVTEKVELRSDGSFVQVLEMPSGSTFTNSSRWRMQHRAIELERYLHFYGVREKKLIDPPEPVAYMTYVWADGFLKNDWDTGFYILRSE